MATEVHVHEIQFTDTTDRRVPGGGMQFGRAGAPFRTITSQKLAVGAGGGANSSALSLGTRYLLIHGDTVCKLTFGTWDAETGDAVDPATPDATSGGILIPANQDVFVIMPVPPVPVPGTSAPAAATGGIKVNVRALAGTEAHINEIELFDPIGPLPFGGVQFGHARAPFLSKFNHFCDVSNGDGTLSAQLLAGTRYIRVCADAACKVTFGTWNAAGAPQDPAVATDTSAGIAIAANTPTIIMTPVPPNNASGHIKVRVRNFAA